MKKIKYYVATIETRYAFQSLALSRERALDLVAAKACKFLNDRDCPVIYDATGEPHTVETAIEYFAPNVTVLYLDTAELEGGGE
jgi:threonine dehydrogenase-like Zn-dependent dehydrogenase